MQPVFVEMYSSTIYTSLDTAWLANYLAKYTVFQKKSSPLGLSW